jgi:DNA-binding response OmpR family regulator
VPKRILVAEEEPAIARLIRINLERAGYDVTVVSDGIEAVVEIVAEQPDLEVIDSSLPRMDGYEVMKYLRADTNLAALPTVFLVGKIGREKRPGCGADVYLTIPFNPMESIASVRSIFRKRAGEDGVWRETFPA